MGHLLKPLILIVCMLIFKATLQKDDKCEAGSRECPKPKRIKRSGTPCFTLEASVVTDHTVWNFFGSLFPALNVSQREQNITNHFRRVYAEGNTRLSHWRDYATELERQGSACPVKCFRVYPRIFHIQKIDSTDWSSTVQLGDGKQYVVNVGGCENAASNGADVMHCWTRLDIALVDAVSQKPLTYYRALGNRGICQPSSVHALEALGHGEDFMVAHAVLQAQGNPGSNLCYFWDRGNDLFPWISAVQPNPVFAQYLTCMMSVCNYITLQPGSSCAFQNSFSSAEWDAFISLNKTAVPYRYDTVCKLNMGLTARHSGQTICRKGWCEWKDLGELGGHCFSDEDCLTANTLCNCHRCECRRAFRLSNNSCVPFKKIKCASGWLQYGYLCFYINHDLLLWQPALDACRTWHGTLVEIDEIGKTEFFVSLLQSNDTVDYFTGGRYNPTSRRFEWVGSKTNIVYNNWNNGHTNMSSTDSCLVVLKHGHFISKSCSVAFKSICQRLSPTFDELGPNEGYVIDQ
ncbi:uncharacterized protein LOC127842161 isoform X2 [Dreissena polymorpha]|uniref:uncharacterized protein LOC127842161 isoform X2 n=1 Tax=Dreissena polymorpha TaxID=45954 RepID=UPI002263D173|nr:uncharacterized protein LOC127842161 isoform X2 [Dreissena polymorpha]